MGTTDLLERLIKQMLEDNDGVAEFSRNELAGQVNCVPSQINYVLNTRFKNSMGYVIYSRRGGSGSVRVERLEYDDEDTPYLMQQMKYLPDGLTQHQAHTLIKNWYERDFIDRTVARLMMAITSHQALGAIPAALDGRVRSDLLKQALTALILDDDAIQSGKEK